MAATADGAGGGGRASGRSVWPTESMLESDETLLASPPSTSTSIAVVGTAIGRADAAEVEAGRTCSKGEAVGRCDRPSDLSCTRLYILAIGDIV